MNDRNEDCCAVPCSTGGIVGGLHEAQQIVSEQIDIIKNIIRQIQQKLQSTNDCPLKEVGKQCEILGYTLESTMYTARSQGGELEQIIKQLGSISDRLS